MLTIGVAARNEEATIADALRSIDEALTELPTEVNVEVIVAVNDSTDRTKEIADAHARRNPRCRVIESPPGLVAAQRAIATAATGTRHTPGRSSIADDRPARVDRPARASRGPSSPDYLIFVDADCLLDRQCLSRLTEVMEDPAIQATWATRVLAGSTRPGFWQATVNFGDYHSDVIVRGHYLVGQAFAIRNYEVAYGSRDGQPQNVVTHLQLDRGPLTDDSYLSRALINDHGPDAIRPAPGAIVYAQPMRTLRDLYRAQRRKAYEVERLNLLFPELRTIRGKHFGRRCDAAAYTRLSRIERLQCRLYLPLYANLWRLAQWQLAVNLWLLRRGVPLRPTNLWPVVEGTKKAFPVT